MKSGYKTQHKWINRGYAIRLASVEYRKNKRFIPDYTVEEACHYIISIRVEQEAYIKNDEGMSDRAYNQFINDVKKHLRSTDDL